MESQQEFIVNGRDHGVASLGEHRQDLSNFSDLLQYRVVTMPSGESRSERATTGCGCASAAESTPSAEDPPERAKVAAIVRANQAFFESIPNACDCDCDVEVRPSTHTREPTGSIPGTSSSHMPGIPLGSVSRTASSDEPMVDCANSLFEQNLQFDRRTLSALAGPQKEVCFDFDEDCDDSCSERPWETGRLKVVDNLVMICGKHNEPSNSIGTTPQAHHTPGHSSPHPPAYGVKCPPLEVRDYALRLHKVGKCYTKYKSEVTAAFELAYKVVRTAERELTTWSQVASDQELRWLWQNAERGNNRATLSYWFGEENSPKFYDRFETIVTTIQNWSHCFRNGFYTGVSIPVLIRCRPTWKCSGSAAFHGEPNVITLCKRWFSKTPEEKATNMIHEMGHYSHHLSPYSPTWTFNAFFGLMLEPRDHRHDVCKIGGSDSKCLRGPLQAPNDIYIGGDPRRIRDEFEKGQVYGDMIHNIDNYVAWMWNRWQDHDYCVFYKWF